MQTNQLPNVSAASYLPSGHNAAASAPPAGQASNQALKSDENTAVIYEHSADQGGKVDPKKMQQIIDDGNRQIEMFRKFIEGVFDKQGRAFTISSADWHKLANSEEHHDRMTKELIEKLRSGELEVDEATRQKALQEISEDGYWGVKQTSERILDLAKSLAGGDPSHIPALRAAFQEGYDSAAALFGDDIPSLMKETYDAVMSGFDEWEEANM